jgi:hypothetical protein
MIVATNLKDNRTGGIKMTLQQRKERHRKSISLKALLIFDERRFYGKIPDDVYYRLRPKLEQRLIRQYGSVYPIFTPTDLFNK